MIGLFRGLFRDPHYKLASLGVAILLWMYVQEGQVVDGTTTVRVEWALPDGLVAVEPLPGTVSVGVRGSRSAVRRAARSAPTIAVDLTSFGEGDHSVDLSAHPIDGVVQSVTVERISPNDVTFSLDEESSRRVVVEPVLVGTPPAGYDVVAALPEPLVVTIRGPRVSIRSRSEVQTRPIDVSALTDDASVPATLDLPRGIERVDENPLVVKVDIRSRRDRRRIEGVAVLVNGPAGWTAEPGTVAVELEGVASALAAVQASDLVVVANLPTPTARSVYAARFGRTDGAHLRVLHDVDEVVAVGVDPSSVEVRGP